MSDLNTEIKNEKNKKNKHLIFALENEKYGIPLSVVKEVIGLTEITPVPHVPTFFKGLINLRGKIISIVDLRIKLNLPQAKYEPKKTTIVITEVNDIVIGAVVDEVNEVIGFEPGQVENNLDIQSRVSREYINGVAKLGEKKLVLLLDIARSLSMDEIKLLKKQHAKEASEAKETSGEE